MGDPRAGRSEGELAGTVSVAGAPGALKWGRASRCNKTKAFVVTGTALNGASCPWWGHHCSSSRERNRGLCGGVSFGVRGPHIACVM